MMNTKGRTMPTLQNIREAHYLSRGKLAKQSGVSESTLIRIETAEHRTTKEVVDKVLKALNELTGGNFTVENVDGLRLYNPMRDRRQRTKALASDQQEDCSPQNDIAA
jgi:transcriptional regulator with XRE-family HTH domain